MTSVPVKKGLEVTQQGLFFFNHVTLRHSVQLLFTHSPNSAMMINLSFFFFLALVCFVLPGLFLPSCFGHKNAKERDTPVSQAHNLH